jgi:hypothetical protein
MTTWGAPACFAATAASKAALPPPITTTDTVSVLIIHAYLAKNSKSESRNTNKPHIQIRSFDCCFNLVI